MHWQRMARVKRKQRSAVYICMTNAVNLGFKVPPLPLVVTITRIGPRKLDDDNLAAACKYVRDQIAAIVGTDDGSPLYTWCYGQRMGQYGVDIEIVTRGDGI